MRAYSYVRWSSAKQTQGDSLRRQTELAANYARKHGLILDPTTAIDAGLSAFTGKNLVEGKLGAFLKAIDDKTIETPCYLCVEALDRITRAEIDTALELFLSIIKRGVTIVTLQNEQVFSSEVIKKDRGISLIIAIATLVQGYEDSAKRGKRVKAAWDNKRERQKDGVIASAKGPAWLKLSADRKHWKVIEAKAATVRRAYELALGGWGSMRIAGLFNDEGVPTLQSAEHWTHGNIGALLAQEAVFGRYKQTRGDLTIDDYYPAIVSKQDFDAVQAGRAARVGKGGAHQDASNFFSGMARCAYCGSSTRFSWSGRGEHRQAYLRCLKAVARAGCDAPGMPYAAMEKAVLHRLINVQARDFSPRRIAEEAEGRIAAIEERIATATKNIERLVELSLSVPDVKMVKSRLEQAQRELDEAQVELSSARETPLTKEEIWNNQKLFEKLVDGDVELRKQAQAALRRQVVRVEVAPRMDLRTDFEVSVEKITARDGRRYEWSKNPRHAAILHYSGGSVRAVQVE